MRCTRFLFLILFALPACNNEDFTLFEEEPADEEPVEEEDGEDEPVLSEILVFRDDDDGDGNADLLCEGDDLDYICIWDRGHVESFEVSPDGRTLTFTVGPGPNAGVWIAPMDHSVAPRQLSTRQVKDVALADSFGAMSFDTGGLVLFDLQGAVTHDLEQSFGEVRAIAALADRILALSNKDNPDQHVPYSIDGDGNATPILPEGWTPPIGGLHVNFYTSPTGDLVLFRFPDPAGTAQYYVGPGDASAPLVLLDAPGTVGHVQVPPTWAPDGRAAFWRQNDQTDQALVGAFFDDTDIAHIVNADIPGTVKSLAAGPAGSVAFDEGGMLYFGDGSGVVPVANVPLLVWDLDVSPGGEFASWVTSSSVNAPRQIQVADRSGAILINETRSKLVVDWRDSSSASVVYRDDASDLDVYAAMRFTQVSTEDLYFLGADARVAAEHQPLGGGRFLRTEDFGSGHTLASLVDHSGSSPIAFDYQDGRLILGPAPDPLAPVCRKVYLPVTTYTNANTSYSRRAVLTLLDGAPVQFNDVDFGRLFMNLSLGSGDGTLQGTDPGFPITYTFHGFSVVGILGNIDADYEDMNGPAAVTGSTILSGTVAVFPSGSFTGSYSPISGTDFIITEDGTVYQLLP